MSIEADNFPNEIWQEFARTVESCIGYRIIPVLSRSGNFIFRVGSHLPESGIELGKYPEEAMYIYNSTAMPPLIEVAYNSESADWEPLTGSVFNYCSSND